VGHRAGSGGTIAAPSGDGWAQLDSQRNSGTALAQAVFWKIASGSDSYAFTFGTTGIKGSAVVMAFTGASGVLDANGQVNGSSTTITAPGLTVSAQPMLRVFLAGRAHDSVIDDVGDWTSDSNATAASGGNATSTRNRVKGQWRAWTDANPGSVSVTSGTAAVNVGHQVALEEAAGPEPQSVSPSGVASTAALGAASIALALSIVASGIASVAAIGAPLLAFVDSVQASGIASTAAIGAPSVDAGSAAQEANPSGIAPTSALGAPGLALAYVLAPSGIASTSALGAPTLALASSVSPTGVSSTAALGAPGVDQPGTINPSGIASTAAIGAPAIAQPISAAPSGIPSTAAIGAPSAVLSGGGGGQAVSPTGISSTAALGAPAIDGGALRVIRLAAAYRPTIGPLAARVAEPIRLAAAYTPAVRLEGEFVNISEAHDWHADEDQVVEWVVEDEDVSGWAIQVEFRASPLSNLVVFGSENGVTTHEGGVVRATFGPGDMAPGFYSYRVLRVDEGFRSVLARGKARVL